MDGAMAWICGFFDTKWAGAEAGGDVVMAFTMFGARAYNHDFDNPMGKPLKFLVQRLLLLTALLAGTACSSFSALRASLHDPVKLPNAGAQAATTSVSPKGEALPNVPLTQEILFRLLAADIAYQRGQWETAYEVTYRLAQQTRDPRLARRAAEMAIGAKRSNEAMAAIKLWHALSPESEDATKYYLGFVLISDNLQAAQPILAQRLKEATPKARGMLMFQTQRLLAATKDKAAAFQMLEALLAPYHGMPEAHVSLAQGALAKGDRERGLQEADKALALKPDFELAALTRAQAASSVEQAMDFLAAFIKAHPDSREVRLAYARMLIAQKKYAEARKIFQELLALQPQDTTVLYSLGLLSAQIKDNAQAEHYLGLYLAALEKQDDAEQDAARVTLLLAQLAEDRGNVGDAIKWLSQIEPQPGQNTTYIAAQIKMAQLLAKQGDLDAARSLLSKAETDGEGDHVQLVLAESQLLREAGQAEAALRLLEAALKRFPKNTALLYDHAMVAETLDQLPTMETSLRKIIVLAPRNAMAYNALGYSLADRNLRLKEARALLEKADKLSPNDAHIMDSVGWVHYRLNNLVEAEQWLRRAYQKRPEPEIAVHLGEVLWVTGRKDEALRFWREAAKKDPKNTTLNNTLKRFKVKL